MTEWARQPQATHALLCDAAKSFAKNPIFNLNYQNARGLSRYACGRGGSWGGGVKSDVGESLNP